MELFYASRAPCLVTPCLPHVGKPGVSELDPDHHTAFLPPLLPPPGRNCKMVQPQETEATSSESTGFQDFTASSRSEVMEQQLFVAKTLLQQAVELLDNHLSSDEQLTVHSKYMPGSTIGKHLRHALDHYILLLNCLTNRTSTVFSYDTRVRDTPMESSRHSAKNVLLETMAKLHKVVPNANPDQEITLNAVTPYMHAFKTTIGREIWFASLHCVHHWSMVRFIAGEIGIQLSDDFGFAPSTLVFNDRDAPLGRGKL